MVRARQLLCMLVAGAILPVTSTREASAVTVSRGTSLVLDAALQTSCTAQLGGSTNCSNNWRSAMSSHSIPLSANDGTLYWDEFGDPVFGGADSNTDNVDGAQATLVVTHGSAFGGWKTMNELGLYLSSDTGNPNADCNAHSSDMIFGQGWFFPGQNRIFVMAACNSMQAEWVVANAFSPWLQTGWHQVHGFHGIWNTLTANRFDDYVHDSFSGSTAVAWVEDQSVFDAWGSGSADICAVALVSGDTAAHVTDRIDNERYNNLLYDSVTQTSRTSVVYYGDCDPNAGYALDDYF